VTDAVNRRNEKHSDGQMCRDVRPRRRLGAATKQSTNECCGFASCSWPQSCLSAHGNGAFVLFMALRAQQAPFAFLPECLGTLNRFARAAIAKQASPGLVGSTVHAAAEHLRARDRVALPPALP
jgi:hypothetical protein